MLKEYMVEKSQFRSKNPNSAKGLTQKPWIPLNKKSSQNGIYIMALLWLEVFFFFFLDCIQTYLVTKHILDLGGVQLKCSQKFTLVSLYAMSPRRTGFHMTPVCADKVCAGLFLIELSRKPEESVKQSPFFPHQGSEATKNKAKFFIRGR